jgi:hypothetical protein
MVTSPLQTEHGFVAGRLGRTHIAALNHRWSIIPLLFPFQSNRANAVSDVEITRRMSGRVSALTPKVPLASKKAKRKPSLHPLHFLVSYLHKVANVPRQPLEQFGHPLRLFC